MDITKYFKQLQPSTETREEAEETEKRDKMESEEGAEETIIQQGKEPMPISEKENRQC